MNIPLNRRDLVVLLLVVGVVSVLTSLVLGLLLVEEVKATGLDLAVDEGTSESGEELLGLSVVLGLAWKILVPFSIIHEDVDCLPLRATCSS